MNTRVLASGIILFIIGLIALGVSAYYTSLGGEVASSIITVLGVIVGGVGAALRSTRAKLASG